MEPARQTFTLIPVTGRAVGARRNPDPDIRANDGADMTTLFGISGSRLRPPLQRSAPLAARPAAVRPQTVIRLGRSAACSLPLLLAAGSRFPLHVFLRAEAFQVLAICLMQARLLSAF